MDVRAAVWTLVVVSLSLSAGCQLVRSPITSAPADTGLDAPIVEPDVPGLDAPRPDVPTPDVPGLDAPRPDVPLPDVPLPDVPAFDGGPDVPPFDAGMDTPIIDTGVDAPMVRPDTPPFDGGVDAPVTPPSCRELFGPRMFCEQTPTHCEFYVVLGDTISCSDVCSTTLGAACLGSFPESTSGCPRASSTDRGCDTTASDRVCRCSRP